MAGLSMDGHICKIHFPTCKHCVQCGAACIHTIAALKNTIKNTTRGIVFLK